MEDQAGSLVAKHVVIVIDDDHAVRSSLKFSLEIEGLMVGTYGNGTELLNAGDFAFCDCFVVDQNMPGISGLDLIGLLRARNCVVPAILITSDPSRALRARAQTAGVPIVEKPLLGNVLVDKIRDAIGLGPS
jgi:two-component system, LuxR family, response regulator FixJ